MPNYIRKMDWGSLRHEYELDAMRLLPWDAIDAPFEGAWCVVRAHTSSTPHHHEERELFIIISGSAEVFIDTVPYTVKMGDMVSIPVGSEHYISNRSDEDFHMYTIFWSTESAQTFIKGKVA